MRLENYQIRRTKSYGRLKFLKMLFYLIRSLHQAFDLNQARRYFEFVGRFFSLWEKGEIHKILINGLYAEVLGPSLNQAQRLIFYLHGGAFVSGSPLTHRHLAFRLAKEAQASALVFDYPLAPEFPFPTALEVSFKAYQWLLERNWSSKRIAFVGDSAGGNLVVALTQKLIKRKYPLPACLVLFSPWVDLSCSSASWEERATRDPMITRSLALERARWYAGEKALTDADISPLFGDLAGFPPMLLFVGSEEVLYDEILALARKANEAGVKVHLIEWLGMFHVWPYLFPILPEGKEACRLASRFLRYHL